MEQTYQELVEEVIKELPILLDYDPQEFFWVLKQNEPERFERMRFDMNMAQPFSSTLSWIISDLEICKLYNRPWKSKHLDENLIRSLKIRQIKNSIK
jgi:hypothetical protein